MLGKPTQVDSVDHNIKTIYCMSLTQTVKTIKLTVLFTTDSALNTRRNHTPLLTTNSALTTTYQGPHPHYYYYRLHLLIFTINSSSSILNID